MFKINIWVLQLNKLYLIRSILILELLINMIKKRFTNTKYSQNVITNEDIFRFKKENKGKFDVKCPDIKELIKIILEKYKEQITKNSQGVILGSDMGNISIKILEEALQDRSKPLDNGEYARFLNFSTFGRTLKVVWSVDNIKNRNALASILAFSAHTSLKEKAKEEIQNDPYKYKKVRCRKSKLV